MKSISILKHNLMRATMTLALIVTCATAWAQTTETVSYIDANGQTQTVTATVLTSSETSLDAGWYVAKGTLNFDHTLNLPNGDVTLILEDGCTMNIGTSASRVNGNGLYKEIGGGSNNLLTIYGQSLDDATAGNLNIYLNGVVMGIRVNKGYAQHGGNVTIDITGGSDRGIYATENTSAITINGGTLSVTADGYPAIWGNGTVTINGGKVDADGKLYGIYAGGDITINGGNVNASGTNNGIRTRSNGNIILGWTKATDRIKANNYNTENGTVSVAPGLAFLTDDDPAQQVSGTITDLSLINGKTLTPDLSSAFTVSADGNTYTIWNAYGWGLFCDAIEGGQSFNGKTVKLGANIGTEQAPIIRMAGSSDHRFGGTFNGQGNTLTFTLSTNYGHIAPFRYVQGTSDNHAIITNLNVISTITVDGDRHLSGLISYQSGHVDVTNCNAEVHLSCTKSTTDHLLYPAGLVSQAASENNGTLTISGCTVTGTITTNGKYAAGLVGVVQNSTSITNCVSSVIINSSVDIAGDKDGTHGGFVAVAYSGTTIITGCLFNGKMLTTNGTTNCGGFVGWRQTSTLTISNCLYAPATIEEGETEVGVSGDDSYTFSRNWTGTPTNSYYTRTLGTAQGKLRHSIAAGENVTSMANAGTPEIVYSVSGITSYGTGIKYNDVLYAGSGDNVSLTLTNTAGEAPTGYQLSYTANNGGTITSSGNSYTLAMPNDDVTISASFSAIPWSGSGTSTDPYLIMYPSQLDLLAYRVNGTHGYTAEADGFSGKYFKLNNNIEYTYTSDWDETSSNESNYEAIGYYGSSSEDRPFKGDFDGNNKTVSGIRIYKSGTGNTDQYQGLFGQTQGANIHDLTLANARITGYKCTGGIVGYSSYYTGHHSTITNCHVAADVAIHAVQSQTKQLGGIAGYNHYNCTISQCTSAATISITGDNEWYYGGIAGYNGQGTLSDNFVVGATIPAAADNRHGAICGYNSDGTLANNFYYACNVAGVANATDMGCNNADITTNDGAIPVFTLTFDEYATTSTDPTVCYNETGYYKSGTIITLGYTNLPESSSLIGYNVNGTSISGNTFPMPDEDATVTVELCNTPPSFGGIYGSITSHGITVRWTGSSESYTLQYRKTVETDWTEIPNITSSPYTIDNLAPETEYLARMVGNCGNISTGPSNEYNFKTLGLCPVPDYLLIKNISSSGASLVWRADNDSYNIKLQKQLYLVTADFETGDFSQASFTNDATYPWTVVANTHSGAYCAKSGNAGVQGSTSELVMVVNLTSPQWLSFSAKVSSEITDIAFFSIDGVEQWETGNSGDWDWNNYRFYLSEGQHTLRWKYNKGFYEDELDDCFYVDDIVITNGLSEVGTYTSSTKNYRFTGLEPRTSYIVQVQGVCNNTPTDWSEESFTTLPKGSITVEGYLEDDYANGNQWVFIASPVVESIAPSEVRNLLGGLLQEDPVLYNFDLYRLEPSTTMWENYHAHTDDFNLVNGQGYLYASSYTKTLVFAGTFNTDASMDVPLQQGWNLVGNPFADPATVNRNYYRMNATGSAIEPVDISQNNESIEACTGIVVKAEATETDPTITFTRVTTQQNATNNKGGLQIALTQTVTTRGGSSTETIDNAIVSFNEGSQLGKFYFGTQNANIYLPQDGKEYAIVSVGGRDGVHTVSTMDVNFKANENGEYTITVNPEGVEMIYLHLIDNMTGADVDLLTTTEYTFNAKVTDYESRFKLVFMANGEDGSSTGSETFAFYSNGSWIIANEGRATLQVIDLNGRILSSETVNGSVSKGIHAAPGMYMIRLINGNDVKVQKVVIE